MSFKPVQCAAHALPDLSREKRKEEKQNVCIFKDRPVSAWHIASQLRSGTQNFSKSYGVPIKSKMLLDLGGPELFMAPYRSQEEPKNEFWWSSKTPQVESGTLLLWPLITRYPIIWGPEQSRGNWGAKIEEARHQ